MTLAKALIYKNRLVQQIKDVRAKLWANNQAIMVRDEWNRELSEDQVIELMKKSDELSNRLVKVKVLLQKSSEEIREKIFALSEMKAKIAFLKTLPTKNKPEYESRYNDEDIVRDYHSVFTAAYVEKSVESLQEEIDKTQAALENFNWQKEIPDLA